MMSAPVATPTFSAAPAYLAFAAFGSLWGVWGAALPQIRDQAGVTDGQLGTALLFVGAGALPAMLLTGRASDRWGRRVPAAGVVSLALAGMVLALIARGPLSLNLALLALGAASGATDVAINAVAGATERACRRPVITRAHAAFSAAVVVASLLTGALRHVQAPLPVMFGPVLVVSLVAARRLLAGVGPQALPATAAASPPAAFPQLAASRQRAVLIGGGLVAALAFAVENAHQSWGAIYLGDVLTVSPAWTAVAPALFATVVAITRYAAGWLAHLDPRTLLLAGGLVATVGTATVAVAPTAWLALVGLAGAAAGTAVLFPTLLSASTRHVDEAVRGQATSTIATTAYLGFLLGPVLVGQLADGFDLRWAMAGVAGIAAIFTVVAGPAVSAARHTT
ncbi:MFS transporter [soil metagenome]